MFALCCVLWWLDIIRFYPYHYDDVIMGTIASQITSLPSVYSTVYSGADQSKHQSSASLAFVWGIHRGPVNSPHKGPVTRKMFPFDDVIMIRQGYFTGTGAIIWLSQWQWSNPEGDRWIHNVESLDATNKPITYIRTAKSCVYSRGL